MSRVLPNRIQLKVPTSFQVFKMETRLFPFLLPEHQSELQSVLQHRLSSFEITLAQVSEPPTDIPAAASC